MGTDTSVSSRREIESFASHPWSGDSSTMALLICRETKTLPNPLLRVKQTFLQTMLFLSDTVHSSLPAAKKYEDYIFFFGDRVALLWTLEYLGVPCSGKEHDPTWWLPQCACLCVSRRQQTQQTLQKSSKISSKESFRLQFITSTYT